MRPKPQPRISNKENLFPIDRVISMLQLRRIVLSHHLRQIAILKPDALDLLARQMPRTPRDRESPLRRRMNQMRRRAQIRRQLRIGFYSSQRRRRPAITILANQRIDALVLAKLLDSRSK